MKLPWVSIASVAQPFIRRPPVLTRELFDEPARAGRHGVREEKLLTLEDAVRKMTSLPAQILDSLIAARFTKGLPPISFWWIRRR